MPKTAREKLETNHPSHGLAFPIPAAMQKSLGHGTMIVPRPLDVDAAMRTPRKGELIAINQIRGKLIDKFPAAHLSREGHKLAPGRGKQPPSVTNFESHLARGEL